MYVNRCNYLLLGRYIGICTQPWKTYGRILGTLERQNVRMLGRWNLELHICIYAYTQIPCYAYYAHLRTFAICLLNYLVT